MTYTPNADDICKLVSAGILTKDEARRALKLPVAERPPIRQKPWFGELSAEDAADMEVGFYTLTLERQARIRAAQK